MCVYVCVRASVWVGTHRPLRELPCRVCPCARVWLCSCVVDFPEHDGWLGLVEELEKVDAPPYAPPCSRTPPPTGRASLVRVGARLCVRSSVEVVPFVVGEVVRVKPAVVTPAYAAPPAPKPF